MTALVYVPFGVDIFEVTVRENLIVRIEKILGDSQTRIELHYDDLSPEARWCINAKLTEENSDE